MKVEVNRKKLLEAWKTVASVVPSTTPMDLLKNIKLSAIGERLTLKGTDREVSIWARATAKVERRGECLLDETRASAVLSAMTGDVVLIDAEAGAVKLTSGGTCVNLNSTDPAAFPDAQADEPDQIEVPESELSDGIAFASVCMDKDGKAGATRCAGVFVGWHRGRLVFASTDSTRMAYQKSIECPEFSGRTVPVKAVACLKRAAFNGPVSVGVSDSKIVFSSGDVTVASMVMQGDWPIAWLDKAEDVSVFSACRIGCGTWNGLWSQVRPVTLEEHQRVKVSFGESLTLSSSTVVGQAEASCPCVFDGASHTGDFAADMVAPLSKPIPAADPIDVEFCSGKSGDIPEALRVRSGNRVFMAMCLED